MTLELTTNAEGSRGACAFWETEREAHRWSQLAMADQGVYRFGKAGMGFWVSVWAFRNLQTTVFIQVGLYMFCALIFFVNIAWSIFLSLLLPCFSFSFSFGERDETICWFSPQIPAIAKGLRLAPGSPV